MQCTHAVALIISILAHFVKQSAEQLFGSPATPTYDGVQNAANDLFKYTLTCNKDDILKNQLHDGVRLYEGTTNAGDTGARCLDILTGAYFNGHVFMQGSSYVGSRQGNAYFYTDDEKYGMTRLKDCCPLGRCNSGCYANMPKCALWIWNPSDSRIMWLGLCNACVQEDCPNLCQNGTYARDFTTLDPETLLKRYSPTCLPCLPGTFNTCQTKPSCDWYETKLSWKTKGSFSTL